MEKGLGAARAPRATQGSALASNVDMTTTIYILRGLTHESVPARISRDAIPTFCVDVNVVKPTSTEGWDWNGPSIG